VALVISSRVFKQLSALPRADSRRLLERLQGIALAPDALHLGVTALSGEPGAYRVRQGDWRGVFRIEDGDVIVDRIAHRKEVYR
jgi:mRNA-degrading endonuclease RelE of RelBE toxin-antitoxin system